MGILSRVISETELTCPDGRPLYRYPLSPETFSELELELRSQVASGRDIELSAPGFVLWAAEHIRSRFTGGSLSWAFVLDPLGLPSEDQQFGRDLAEQGLRWWNRQIKRSDAGIRMFLYSLVAEGGIPEALLKEAGLYRNVVMGLLAEIEAEGVSAAEPWAEQIASRWVSRLPQTFQSTDVTRLLAALALSLVDLRSLLPNDLPEAAAEQWLNKHRPDWSSSIPLRMTPEIAESLIRPALRAERNIHTADAGPICGRELRLGENGCWQGYLLLHDNGWLSQGHFPDAQGLRLRLLPTEASIAEGVAYNATPEESGWRLRRLGKAGRTAIPLMPDVPFALAAFADGQPKGEAVIDTGVASPIEMSSFWRAAKLSKRDTSERLTPLAGAARTRGRCLWLLTSESEEPEASEGLTLDEVETAPDGFLWRISGRGVLHVGERRYRVETGAEEDAPEARLFAFGDILRGWRLFGGNIPVYRGDIDIHGQIGVDRSIRVAGSQLRSVQGRDLCSEIVEWTQGDEALARLRLVRVSQSISLNLQEVSAGRIELSACGLDTGWRLRLRAGEYQAMSEVQDGTVELTLDTPGRAPGLVQLRLSEPISGRTLELQTAWPARSGMIVDPEGTRLERSRPISVQALQGWRALTPDGVTGDLQLQLRGHPPVSLPTAGEVPIASHMPSIQAMLAQGGADAQVNLSLVVSGREGPRLEIRRYHDYAVIDDSTLRTGLDRNELAKFETVLAFRLNEARRAVLHAVDLSDSRQVGPIETGASVDLANHLERSAGPWLIQSTLEGRVQRAAVWNTRADGKVTREERIDAYAEKWRNLVDVPQDPDWDRLWQLISAVGQDGDSGALDQVQALARVPEAAIALALRIPGKELSEVFALETAAPIFWPALAVSDFSTAVRADHSRQQKNLAPYLDHAEATELADQALARRIGDILLLRPDLVGHLCTALMETGLFERLIGSPETRERLMGLLLASPSELLAEVAQEAARRFDRLPQGVGGLLPIERPEGFPVFNSYAQAMIDAPLVAAEMAAGRRPAPDVQEKLVLINLRLIDPLYFDAALPAALALCQSNVDR